MSWQCLTTGKEELKRARHASYMQIWRARNPDRAREISRAGNLKYRREKTDRYKASYVKYNDRVRAEIIAFFGGKCVRCGFDDPRCLQMDHVNGDGGVERKAFAGRNIGLTLAYRYRLVKKEPERTRSRFQLLCANCNSIKRFENHEYNNGRPRKLP